MHYNIIKNGGYMKGNCEEVKLSVYAGMSIFDLLKGCEIKIWDKAISIEDKKYLSLYLGIINTKNKISSYLDKENIKFNILINFNFLHQDKYLKIYNEYFSDILMDVDFESIENYLTYLLSKDIIKSFNKSNGYHVNKAINERHKKLIKTIN